MAEQEAIIPAMEEATNIILELNLKLLRANQITLNTRTMTQWITEAHCIDQGLLQTDQTSSQLRIGSRELRLEANQLYNVRA